MKKLILATVLCSSQTAFAQWGATAAYTRYMNTEDGANLGDYGSVAAWRSSTVGPLMLSPSLAAEYAPKTKFWGLMLGANLDYPVHERVGLDFMVWIWNDLNGTDFANAAYYAGGGPGASIFLGKWTLSPYVNFYRGFHGGVPWVIAPGVGVGYSF